MIVTIHQPEFLPWLGFFDKAAQADTFVLLDNVQYRHKYFQNRNRIRSAGGECWLHVPVLLKGQGRPVIKDIRINSREVRWAEKCWKSLLLNYAKAPHFSDHAAFFEGVFHREWDLLVELNVSIIRYLLKAFDVQASLILASDLGINGAGPDLILEIVKGVGGTSYISGVSGIAGRGSEFEAQFRAEGIDVRYQEFFHPIYRQLFDPFLPCLSAIDLLFNYGAGSTDVLHGVGVEKMEKVFT
jgi:WbqC-like protein family